MKVYHFICLKSYTVYRLINAIASYIILSLFSFIITNITQMI
jgi:hypothetical protein